jgi:hypothetical protein
VIYLSRVPAGLKTLMVTGIALDGITCLVNLFAAYQGTTALSKPAVSRAFRRNR